MQNTNDFIGLRLFEQLVMGRRTFMPPLRYQDELINEARIVHVLQGCSTLICADKVLSLKAGDTVLMKADNFVNSWQRLPEQQTVQFIGFQLSVSLLDKLYPHQVPKAFANTSQVRISSATLLPSSPLLTCYFESLSGYFSQSEKVSETLTALKIQELIELILQLDSKEQLRNALGQLFTDSEFKLQEVVRQHLYNNINIEELAFLCGQSLSTFNRKFKHIYGTSPNQYIICKRLEKAQNLITNSNRSLTNIAYDCGFEDVSYFSRIFKKHYHCSPSDLRK